MSAWWGGQVAGNAVPLRMLPRSPPLAKAHRAGYSAV
jgi:hypothetical protein